MGWNRNDKIFTNSFNKIHNGIHNLKPEKIYNKQSKATKLWKEPEIVSAAGYSNVSKIIFGKNGINTFLRNCNINRQICFVLFPPQVWCDK